MVFIFYDLPVKQLDSLITSHDASLTGEIITDTSTLRHNVKQFQHEGSTKELGQLLEKFSELLQGSKR